MQYQFKIKYFRTLIKDVIGYGFDINNLNYKLSLNNLEQELININHHLTYKHYKNVNIPYGNFNLNYDHDFEVIYKNNDFKMLLPLNMAIVKQLGKARRWCINGTRYEEKILKNESIIVFIEKGNKIDTCVEFKENFKELIQAKKSRNKIIDEDVNNFLIDFCLKNKITIKTKDIYISEQIMEVC